MVRDALPRDSAGLTIIGIVATPASPVPRRKNETYRAAAGVVKTDLIATIGGQRAAGMASTERSGLLGGGARILPTVSIMRPPA
jgi:hypothetical protein